MSPETRTTREFLQRRLAKLCLGLPGVRLAAVMSEDGLLAATHAEVQPAPIDRRAAVSASLMALARAAAREIAGSELRGLRISTDQGTLVLSPLGQPRRRLLLLVLDASADLAAATQAAAALAADFEERLAPSATG